MISNIKNWFHNYWYYYKWRVIIVSFFVVIAVFCTVQFFTQNKTTDVTVAFIGPYFPAADSEKEIGNAFSQIMSKDLNGDGKKNATVIITSAFTDDEIIEAVGQDADLNAKLKYAQFTVSSVESKVSNLIFAGDANILLLDEFWYERLKSANALAKISEIAEDSKYEIIDGYYVILSETKFGQFFDSLGSLPDDTRICFRVLPSSSAFTGKKQSEINYENSKAVLRDLLGF
ncbi:MAG: hypothetical protein J5850_00115 [Clostridia bacterium]|nr:hypothetical protein [Clostridia bacterium]